MLTAALVGGVQPSSNTNSIILVAPRRPSHNSAAETDTGVPAQPQQMQGMMESMQGMMQHMQGMMERMQGMMGHEVWARWPKKTMTRTPPRNAGLMGRRGDGHGWHDGAWWDDGPPSGAAGAAARAH